MEWIRSRPYYEKFAYLIVFSIISYWIIEIKGKPFRFHTSDKYIMRKYEIDKDKNPKPPGGYLDEILDQAFNELEAQREKKYTDNSLSKKNIDYDLSNKKFSYTLDEWKQGYYEKRERDGYYYHSKFNTFPFIVWLISGFIFSSLIFSRQKDSKHPNTQDKPTTE